jgi:predicted metal-dependent phosphoesterase TrpH
LIDLHLHTTASDGVLRPVDLVARAAAAGIITLSVTDHDTTGGLDEARDAASARGLTFINGIEITAVENERDTHVLGYFFDPADAALRRFVLRQREDRIRRVREMAERLEALGAPIDSEPLIARGLESGQSVGRPHVAAALIARGHVQSWDEAFDRYLEKGRPAFVARRGASAADVVRVIQQAGGIASLAHPGLSRVDPLIPALAAAGLDAIEARHSEHDAETEARYRALALSLGLAVSGGSDFHGDAAGRRCALGDVTMTAEDLSGLEARRR